MRGLGIRRACAFAATCRCDIAGEMVVRLWPFSKLVAGGQWASWRCGGLRCLLACLHVPPRLPLATLLLLSNAVRRHFATVCARAQVLEGQAGQAQRAHPLVRHLSGGGCGLQHGAHAMPLTSPEAPPLPRCCSLVPLCPSASAPQLGQLQVEPAQVAGAHFRPVRLCQ